MRTKLLVAAVALAAAVIPTVSANGLSAASSPSAVHPVAPGTRLLFTFDNGESLKPGTRVRDTSGHRHHGVVMVQGGGELRRTAGLFRRGADFPARCLGCGRAIIEVDDGRGLDPRRRAFTFGAAVKVTRSQGRSGSNIVQKGFFHEDGGQYKLQLRSGGAPSCVVFGPRGRVKVTAQRSVTNGRWHRLSCTRRPTRVVLRIDGRVGGRAMGATGRIASTAPVRIGGKKINPANKQYHGDLDSVYMRVLPRR